MMRAGVVKHPREWPWTGWHELAEKRGRLRLIDRDALLARLEGLTWTQFQNHYRSLVDEAASRADYAQRDARWTEAIAVGSPSFVARIEAELVVDDRRRRLDRTEISDGTWILREPSIDYDITSENDGKNSPIRAEISHFYA
jgi:hypothetical protein